MPALTCHLKKRDQLRFTRFLLTSSEQGDFLSESDLRRSRMNGTFLTASLSRWNLIGMVVLVFALISGSSTPAAAGPVAPPCIGDCDNTGSVSIANVTLGVNILLGFRALSDCPAFADAEGNVTVATLIGGINNVLGGIDPEGRPCETFEPCLVRCVCTNPASTVEVGDCTAGLCQSPRREFPENGCPSACGLLGQEFTGEFCNVN